MKTTSELKRTAKAALNGHWGCAIGVLLIDTIICGTVGVVIPVIGSIASVILAGPMAVGYAMFQLAVLRRQDQAIGVGTLFNGFSTFGNNWDSALLVGFYTFLWSLLFIVPGIVKTFSYSMTYFILADHPEMSANQAITESRRIMDGHKMDLFILLLSFIGWWLLSALTLNILGIFYVTPYQVQTIAAFYEEIRGGHDDVVVDVPPLP